MTNVRTYATLWPAIRFQVDAIIHELIGEHTAEVVAFARQYGQRIPWEQRVELWLSFSLAHPAIEVDHETFMDAFRDVHTLWPNGRRIIRRKR
jgi:hypothetical protein